MTTTYTTSHRQLSFDTSRYERLLHDMRSTRGALQGAITSAASALSGVPTDAAIVTDSKSQDFAAAVGDVQDLSGEIFARLFNDPNRLDVPSDEVAIAEPTHEAISQLPEFEALRQSVQADPDFSAIATASLLNEMAARMPDLAKAAEQEKKDREEGREAGEGTSAADLVRAALRAGLKVARSSVNDGKEALNGLFPGLGDAPPAYVQEDPRRLELAELVLSNQKVREAIRKAGRISRLASAGKRQRDPNARSEVYGLERGGDVSRILPTELLGLVDPDFEDLSLMAIAERTAMQYKLVGTEVLGRGPIVCLLDRSGSMREPDSDPETWASAAAIALVAQGHKERRPVTVVEFAKTVQRVYRVADGEAVTLDPNCAGWVTGKLPAVADVTYALASVRSYGGTKFDSALRYGLEAGALDDRADLVFVTDGLAERAGDDVIAKLTEAKDRGLRVFALTVNGGSLAPAIEQIADVAIDLDRVEDVGAAIASAIPQT